MVYCRNEIVAPDLNPGEKGEPVSRSTIEKNFNKLSSSSVGEGLNKLQKKDLVSKSQKAYYVNEKIDKEDIEELRPPKI